MINALAERINLSYQQPAMSMINPVQKPTIAAAVESNVESNDVTALEQTQSKSLIDEQKVAINALRDEVMRQSAARA